MECNTEKTQKWRIMFKHKTETEIGTREVIFSIFISIWYVSDFSTHMYLGFENISAFTLSFKF